jgi:hypothetical protein
VSNLIDNNDASAEAKQFIYCQSILFIFMVKPVKKYLQKQIFLTHRKLKKKKKIGFV